MVGFFLCGVGWTDHGQCMRKMSDLLFCFRKVCLRPSMFPEEKPISVSSDPFLYPKISKVPDGDLVAKPLMTQLVMQQQVVLRFSHRHKLEVVTVGIDCL